MSQMRCPHCGGDLLLLKRADSEAEPVGARAIIAAVSNETGVGTRKLLGQNRARHVVRARWAAAHLLHTKLGLSTPEIGKLLRRDHSTIVHGLQESSTIPAFVEWAESLIVKEAAE